MARALRSTLVLLLAFGVVRSAGFAFGILNIDESDYLVFGAAALRGELPYRDLVEVKPPLGFFTWIPGGLLGGLDVWPMRVVGLAWVIGTALVLRAAALRWTRDETTGLCAAWLSLLAGCCEVPSFGNELMMNLPAAAALLFFARARTGGSRRDELWAGVFVGLASLYKLQASIEGVALGVAAITGALAASSAPGASLAARLREGALRGSLLLAGFLLPWGLAFGGYAALGAREAFVDWVFVRSIAYAATGAAGSSLARFFASTLVCLSATIVPWVLASRESLRWLKTRPVEPVGLAAALFLWLTWLPVSAGGRFYEHYYLQFIPALALLGAPAAAALVSRFPSLGRTRRTLLVLGCTLPLLAITGYGWARGLMGAYPAQEPRTIEVAAFLRAQSSPGDRLFVWGHYTPLYVLAQMLPGTRHPNTAVHMGNFDPLHLAPGFEPARFRSDRDVQATLDDLARRRPRWIVDTAPADIHGWGKIPLASFPDLAAFIEERYERVGTPAGAVVYRLR